jgi:hypothetical protein
LPKHIVLNVNDILLQLLKTKIRAKNPGKTNFNFLNKDRIDTDFFFFGLRLQREHSFVTDPDLILNSGILFIMESPHQFVSVLMVILIG